jgi:hypothetical protein
MVSGLMTILGLPLGNGGAKPTGRLRGFEKGFVIGHAKKTHGEPVGVHLGHVSAKLPIGRTTLGVRCQIPRLVRGLKRHQAARL